MIDVTFRPIDTWPGALTPDTQRTYAFKASWHDTLDLLDRELRALDAEHIVIQLALTERKIRRDGWPTADARPEHPGVILAFESKHGPLKYATDVFRGGQWRPNRDSLPGWQCNLRAIALGLEALRKVDRYGITQRGEQYRGWNALPPGVAMGAPMTTGEAARVLADLSGRQDCERALPINRELVAEVYRDAARLHHPDRGGDPDLFRRATEARDVLVS